MALLAAACIAVPKFATMAGRWMARIRVGVAGEGEGLVTVGAMLMVTTIVV